MPLQSGNRVLSLDAVRVPAVEAMGTLRPYPAGQGAFGAVSGGPVWGPTVLRDPCNQLIRPGLPAPVTADPDTFCPARVGFVQYPVVSLASSAFGSSAASLQGVPVPHRGWEAAQANALFADSAQERFCTEAGGGRVSWLTLLRLAAVGTRMRPHKPVRNCRVGH